MRQELARAHACDLGSDLQKRGVPSVRLGKCEQRKRSAGCLTSRDGIKDGDFPVDCARRAASLDAKDGIIEFIRPFLCSLCSRVPTRSEFSHLAAFSYFCFGFFFLFSCVFFFPLLEALGGTGGGSRLKVCFQVRRERQSSQSAMWG